MLGLRSWAFPSPSLLRSVLVPVQCSFTSCKPFCFAVGHKDLPDLQVLLLLVLETVPLLIVTWTPLEAFFG